MAADLHRGINLTNWFRFPASTAPAALQSHISDKTLAELRAAGFDFVRLAVESKNVVQSGEGRHVLDAAVGARCIVDLQPGFERFGPFGGGCVRLSIGPFA